VERVGGGVVNKLGRTTSRITGNQRETEEAGRKKKEREKKGRKERQSKNQNGQNEECMWNVRGGGKLGTGQTRL